MKRLLYVFVAALLLQSCSFIGAIKNLDEISDGTDEEFAAYPGMNASTEPLKGRAYAFPQGIKIEVKAADNDVDQTAESVRDNYYGSGCFVVNELKISNTGDQKVALVLPAGLMVQSGSSDYQNGLLVKDVTLTLKANETITIFLNMYCLNASAHASDLDASYGICGICDIEAFKPLFNVCEEKKVNIEEYKTLGILKYYSATLTIQEIVWAITQGKTFTEKEIKGYLKRIAKD